MFGRNSKAITGSLPGITLFKGVVPTVASLAFIIYISYLGWMSLGPERPVPDEKRQNIAAKGIENMMAALRSGRGDINTAVLLHFANDSTDFVTDSLRLQLNNSGVLALEDRTFFEKVRKKLNLVNKGVATRTEALKAAQGESADGLLWGTIECFESFPEGARIKGRWELIDLKTRTVKASGVIDEDSSRKPPVVQNAVEKAAATEKAVREFLGGIPLSLRIAAYLFCMCVLPLIPFHFIRKQVARSSNRVNALLLGALTFIDLLLALLLVSGAFVTPAGVFLFLGAGAAGFFYNAGMMNFARKLES